MKSFYVFVIRYIGIVGPKGCFSSSACRALLLFERAKINAMGPCEVDSSVCWASGWLRAQMLYSAWHQRHNSGVKNYRGHVVTCPATKSTGALTVVSDRFYLLDSTRGPGLSRFRFRSSREGHGAIGQPLFVAACQNVTHFGRCPGAGLGRASMSLT